jgi:hypothetical protein
MAEGRGRRAEGGGRRAEGGVVGGWRASRRRVVRVEGGGGVIFYVCLLPSGGAGCRSVGVCTGSSTTNR